MTKAKSALVGRRRIVEAALRHRSRRTMPGQRQSEVPLKLCSSFHANPSISHYKAYAH